MTSQAQIPSQEDIHKSSLRLAADAPAIIPFLEDEIQRFDAEVDRFRTGELDNTCSRPSDCARECTGSGRLTCR